MNEAIAALEVYMEQHGKTPALDRAMSFLLCKQSLVYGVILAIVQDQEE